MTTKYDLNPLGVTDLNATGVGKFKRSEGQHYFLDVSMWDKAFLGSCF